MFTSVSLSLFRVLSPSFIFSCTTTFLHISNALLVTAVDVKLKLGDNALNNERLSSVMMKLPKKGTSCSPYFTTLQYINNFETN